MPNVLNHGAMPNDADAIVEVRFRTEAEGGRRTPVPSGVYSCPLLVDGEGFDCRIVLGQEIVPGETYDLPVRFLSRDLAMPRLSPGRAISLWEGREIADGRVKEVAFPAGRSRPTS